jgi:hypothetical protein
LINNVENEVKKRKKISMPSQEQMQKGLRDVLEGMSDDEEYEENECISNAINKTKSKFPRL